VNKERVLSKRERPEELEELLECAVIWLASKHLFKKKKEGGKG